MTGAIARVGPVLSFVTGLAGGWKGYALAAGASAAIGFGGCWWLRDQMAAHAQLAQAHADLKQAQHVDAVDRQGAAISAAAGVQAEASGERIRTVYRTLTEKVPEYVPPSTDARFPVPTRFVSLWNAAAEGRQLPDLGGPAGGADDTASPVAFSEVATAVVDTDEACHLDQDHLSRLQALYLQQKALLDRETTPAH